MSSLPQEPKSLSEQARQPWTEPGAQTSDVIATVIAAGEKGVRGDVAVGDAANDNGAPRVTIDVAEDGCAAEAAATEQLQDGVCRICQLGDGDDDGALPEHVSGRLVKLSCSCRGELAVAQRRCAAAWITFRGDRICEICGKNMVDIHDGVGMQKFMQQWHDGRDSSKTCGFFKRQSCCSVLTTCFMIILIFPWLQRNHII